MTAKEIPLFHFRSNSEKQLGFEINTIETMNARARADFPNRHTFYEIIYITDGSGVHCIDFENYPIQPNTLYFITPGEIHFWQIEQPLSGYVILFTEDFIGLHSQGLSLLSELSFFHHINNKPTLLLTEQQHTEFSSLLDKLMLEFNQSQFGQMWVIQSLLVVFLVNLQRYYTLADNLDGLSNSAASELVQRFKKLVEEHCLIHHTVQPYAQMLSVTPAYLTESVKQITGLPAGQVVRWQIILEAKRRLAHTNQTVTEICYELNFADRSYFGRFFKRETGQSPLEFRQSFRKKHQLT